MGKDRRFSSWASGPKRLHSHVWSVEGGQSKSNSNPVSVLFYIYGLPSNLTEKYSSKREVPDVCCQATTYGKSKLDVGQQGNSFLSRNKVMSMTGAVLELFSSFVLVYATGSPGPPFTSIQRRCAIFHTDTLSLFVLFRAY